MSGKNDRIILSSLIAIAVIAVAGAAAAFGYGAYVFANGQPPAPTPTATPAPTPAPTSPPAVAGDPFSITIISDRAGRTYQVTLGLADDAEPIDVRRVAAELRSAGQAYPAWDFGHGEGRWSKSADGDTVLDRGEAFTLTISAPQAGLPFGTTAPVQIVLHVDGAPASTTNVTAV